jgi:predicted lysophospholipase L1 biosynthesis ABC-type transport system permease subunit
MRIPLVSGRYFSAADDRPDAPLSVIVSQSLAQNYWPNQDAVGKRLKFGGNPNSPFPYATVVGIVGDVHPDALDQQIYPQMYEPLSQLTRQFGTKTLLYMGGKIRSRAYLALSTTDDPATLTESLQQAVRQLDPLLALENVESMDSVLSAAEAPRRFNTIAITTFAGIALLLALLGIYGVLAYSVNERARDIAIRIALGATRESVLGLVMRSALLLAAIGIAGGLAASTWLSHFMNSLLYEVVAYDAIAISGAVALLFICAALAAWLPARRAASIDPMQVLRLE